MGHVDHCGGAAALRAWGDVTVAAHHADAPIVRGLRTRAEPVLTPAETDLFTRVSTTMPAEVPCPVDVELDDGDTPGLLLGPFNTDRARAKASLAALSQIPATTVCFGHGDPLTGPDGAAAWRRLGERCAAGPDAVPDPLG